MNLPSFKLRGVRRKICAARRFLFSYIRLLRHICAPIRLRLHLHPVYRCAAIHVYAAARYNLQRCGNGGNIEYRRGRNGLGLRGRIEPGLRCARALRCPVEREIYCVHRGERSYIRRVGRTVVLHKIGAGLAYGHRIRTGSMGKRRTDERIVHIKFKRTSACRNRRRRGICTQSLSICRTRSARSARGCSNLWE